VEAGNFPISAAQLGSLLSTRVIPDTSLLQLTITYTDPVLAADMANELARQLIANSPSYLTPEQQAQIDLANAEIARLNEELSQTRLQLGTINTQLSAATDAAEIAALRGQRNELLKLINDASANIAQFSNNVTSLQRRSNSLDIVEQARIPSDPVGSTVFMSTLLGAVVGVALGGGIALLLEYLDDTIRSPEDATQMLALPTLAAIRRFGSKRDSYSKRLITYRDPGSPISEAYRTLRTNLLFSSNGNWSKGAYIITSPGPSEGKSVTTANLAVAMAMAGLRVLLVDADLRRPRLHEIFSLDNNVGLSTLLSADLGDGTHDGDEHQGQLLRNLRECLQETEIPGLRVITSGYIPLNPTEVLGSVAMQHWFQEFRSSKNVDIILFDTPPALVVADSSVLAAAIKAPTVMVLDAGHTRRSAALRAKEQFEQLGVEIKGVVLNNINARDQGYGYGYGYGGYYYYYRDSGNKTRQGD
jgi:capsular exopolysaccharide synthesis family protein